jgi:hypothetical protein
MIFEGYLRLDVDQVSHARNVFTLMDFIGNLGGVSGLLLEILGWIIGGYAAFHSSIATLAILYKVKNNGQGSFLHSKKNDPDQPDITKIKFGLRTKIFLFFLQSPVGFLFGCCKKPEHEYCL